MRRDDRGSRPAAPPRQGHRLGDGRVLDAAAGHGREDGPRVGQGSDRRADARDPAAITVDCDVIQADGGTRTASITGGYVALASALITYGMERHLVGKAAAVSVGIVNIDLQRGGPILRSMKDDEALTNPSISPDGTTLVVCIGKYQGDGNFTHEFLYTYAAQVGAGATVRELVAGDARDPSWSPDGNKVVYVKALEDGTREIHTVNADGTDDKAIASGKGDFIKPVFSPQT